jgi:hypothetical protein
MRTAVSERLLSGFIIIFRKFFAKAAFAICNRAGSAIMMEGSILRARVSEVRRPPFG